MVPHGSTCVCNVCDDRGGNAPVRHCGFPVHFIFLLGRPCFHACVCVFRRAGVVLVPCCAVGAVLALSAARSATPSPSQVFEVSVSALELPSSKLAIEVWDSDFGIGKDDFLGMIVMRWGAWS